MITFILTNKARDRSPIALLVSFKGKKYKKCTGVSCLVRMWNQNKKRIKVTTSNPEANEDNDTLDKWEIAAKETLSEFKTCRKAPDPKEFISKIQYRFYGEQNNDDDEEDAKIGFFDAFDDYLLTHKMSDVTITNHKVIYRALKRYELYSRNKLTLDDVTPKILSDFEDFLVKEHTFFTHNESGGVICIQAYKHIYEACPETRTPKQRGRNTIASIHNKLRTFFHWCKTKRYTNNYPYENFEMKNASYGTPFYLTIEERNALYHFDFSFRPSLARQRDIFVFQCLIGCRISDLMALTKSNVINGAIEYIPRKTIEDRAKVIRVPLNSIAKEILDKYDDNDEDKLFPYISSQKYNDAIKEMLSIAGINRLVTILDTVTQEQKQVPICDVASCHMARRTFIGNLYKKVKDPNLVGSLSGHKEGSRAFSRYREIDEEIKIDLVKSIE